MLIPSLPAEQMISTLAAAAVLTAVGQPLVAGRAAEAEVDDPGAVRGRVADAVGDRAHVPGAVGVEHLDGHDPRLRRDADDAAPVLRGRDRAGDVRAVPGAVAEVLGLAPRRQVDAVDVVDVAVAVVVLAVAAAPRRSSSRCSCARSGWSICVPESTTATTTPAPRVSSHAPGRSNTVPGATAHCSRWRVSCADAGATPVRVATPTAAMTALPRAHRWCRGRATVRHS